MRYFVLITIISLAFSSCGQSTDDSTYTAATPSAVESEDLTFAQQLSDAAIELTEDDVSYDPSYFSIDYPGGDVPSNLGVCTDVVIRAYRTLDIDLQELVHIDMKENFDTYPTTWGLKRPDTNIDHRRVPNLMVFFERHGESLPLSLKAKDFIAGDIVCWELAGGLTHIGIVIDEESWTGNRPLIIHNIGAGQVKQDCLFDYEMIGHYRFEE